MWTIYGSRVSYYTGKLEAYLRYKGIAYRRVPMPYGNLQRIRQNVGAIQHPIVERGDGRWMSDTTPIMLQVEREQPQPTILPPDPVVRFMTSLIEDYADEWLWRSAMHYRWSYPLSRLLLGEILTGEVKEAGRPYPRFVIRRIIKRRQRRHFVVRDGVDETTWAHNDKTYLNALDAMSAMLEKRPFLFGNAPSLADFGLMAPMFRHFSMDPVPEEIMRNHAPLVYEWVARMWRAQSQVPPDFLGAVPDDAGDLLREACETHLVQLAANAEAFGRDDSHFAATVQCCEYRKLPVSRYRVWCLEELRKSFAALDAEAQSKIRDLLPYDGADVLWKGDLAASGFNEDGHLPFGKAINVYGDGTPP